MKLKLSSLRFHMLLPVIAMTLFVVIMLTMLFSRAYTRMILRQEQEENAAGFELASRSITTLVESSISQVRSVISDDRVISYAGLSYSTAAELVHARISCRDYLKGEIIRNDGVFGLLFMRKDESMFGTLPEGYFFMDSPEENPLPDTMKAQILNTPLGQIVWTGPIAGAELYGFENETMPQSIMIAAWKSVDVSYGECYAMMLMDESIFDRLFAALQDGKSTWHLFAEDQTEIYHTGQEECLEPERLLSANNSGLILRDENGHSVCAFSMTMTSPAWTLVREVSMEEYEQVIQGVRSSVAILAAVVFLVALAIYELWLKKFMRQFNSLKEGIVRMGEGDLEPIPFEPFSIGEFEVMQQEIDRTSLALSDQMVTIRRMEREQIEQEHEKRERERFLQELSMAREVQRSTIPHIFPAFPERMEFSLHASMTPAKEVGGDFYDFFLIDRDHLAMVIGDVSGKGIPAALFMMVSKTLLKNQLMSGCDPATALESVNLQLCENNSSMMFVTVWLAVLEISTGKGLACNAGHENPGLRRADGRFELLKYRHGVMVGVSKKARYQNREFVLQHGDCIFVYTDGIPEATAVSGEMFGEGRMVEALNTFAHGSPEEILQGMRSSVDAFVGDAEQFDDLTMMCLEYKGPDSSRPDDIERI